MKSRADRIVELIVCTLMFVLLAVLWVKLLGTSIIWSILIFLVIVMIAVLIVNSIQELRN